MISFGQEIPLARDHCRRDGARVAANDCVDAVRERIAAAIDRHHRRGREPNRGGRSHDLDAPQHIADGAELREPGIAGEIIAAGQTRARWRQQPRLEAHNSAGLERRGAARRQPHPDRRRIGRKASGGMDPQKKARPSAAEVHFLDRTFERGDPDLIDRRRRDTRRPQRRRKLPREEGAHTAKEKKGDPVGAGEISEDAERQSCGRDKPEGRLAVGAKIENDPRAGRDRQPKKRAPKRRLCLESLFEEIEEKRESDGEFSREAPRPAQASSGDCCFGHSRHGSMLDRFYYLWN